MESEKDNSDFAPGTESDGNDDDDFERIIYTRIRKRETLKKVDYTK